MGIEPTWPAWKAGALPLSYTRNPMSPRLPLRPKIANHQSKIQGIGQGGIRTPVGQSPSDLQSDAIGRSATCPPGPPLLPQQRTKPRRLATAVSQRPSVREGTQRGKLAMGFEPITSGLQNRCSAVELR